MYFLLTLIYQLQKLELIGVDNKEYILRSEVEKVKDSYDYIVIDCPPALSMLTINAMTYC